jgi:hypothetical protein
MIFTSKQGVKSFTTLLDAAYEFQIHPELLVTFQNCHNIPNCMNSLSHAHH